jgi:L-alanine-DL-glutamate epimerase-like enolase superfamily enzyme
MNIREIRSRRVRSPLTRPYAISGGAWDAAEFVVVELETEDGLVGYGHASPAEEVTGESVDAAERELAPARLAPLLGLDHRRFDLLFEALYADVRGAAARAAVDAALFDLDAKRAGLPLVERLGRKHVAFPTSVTIGVKDAAATLEEAAECFGRGFRALKVKTGVDCEEDVRRLTLLRERFGREFLLRADANQGYDFAALRAFAPALDALGIEFLEQPCSPEEDDALRTLPADVRRRLVADESVHDASDLRRLSGRDRPFGGVNIKLMKCGGVAPALRLAAAASLEEIDVMWGCNDESVAGISAALHAALAARATRWLDLDGSLDLAADPFTGGFALVDGMLTTLALPGLGVAPR